jgi:ABC-type polysaccharide/polyol phosphate export permease
VPQSVAELLRYRYLFEQMVRRELRQKYKGSLLGVLWYLANPLALMGAYTIMFTVVLHPVFHVHDYALFVLVGIVVWMFFQQSLMGAATSLLDQGALVRRVVFPRETIPAAAVTVQLVTFAVMLTLVAAVVIPIHGSLSVVLLELPLLVTLLFCFALGLGLMVSILHAYFRDVEPILGAALLPWFMVSPTFFPVDRFPGISSHPWAREVLHWANPVAPFITAVRDVVFNGRGAALDDVGYMIAIAALSLTLGLTLFRRMQSELAVVV